MSATRRLLLLTILSAAVLLAGCERRRTIRGMVEFDQAFIPVLALTHQGDRVGSERAMVVLREADTRLQRQYADAIGSDATWAAAFARVQKDIRDADRALSERGDVESAHETLESVRMTLLELRRRNQVAYFPDLLTDFHGPMERVVQLTKGKTPDTLAETDVEEIRRLTPRLSELWRAVEARPFDPDAYGFGAERWARLRVGVRAVRQAISDLENAVAADDRQRVVRAAPVLRARFAECYTLFGRSAGRPW